jgi:hypothetical protein
MKLSCWLISFFFLILIQPVLAQETGEEEPSPSSVFTYPATFIKFSPLALMELPNPSLQFGVEYRVGWPMYLQHEVGWIMPMRGNTFFSEGNVPGGVKVKSELRYYLEGAQEENFLPRRTYVAFEGLYRMRIVERSGWETMGNGSFSQFLELAQYRHQAGFHFKYGRVIKLAPSSRVYVDSYLGLGLRRYFSTTRRYADQIASEPAFDRWSYDYVLPSLSLGFRLGFGL